jgi:uncharacterized protein (TIGR02246 family)
MTDDERQIRNLVDSWMAASKAGDLPALLELITDDVVFMVPGRGPFGKAEFVAGSESMRGASLDSRAEIKEIEIFGPRAVIRNHIDGRWRLARDANLVTPD